MKAIEILEWISKGCILGECVSFIEVPDTDDEFFPQTEDWWDGMFGTYPPKPVPSGKYMYYYSGDADEIQIGCEIYTPDVTLHLKDSKELIYLYKVEC